MIGSGVYYARWAIVASLIHSDAHRRRLDLGNLKPAVCCCGSDVTNMIYSNNVSQLIYTGKDCRLLFFFFWRWILTSAHEEHCLQQRDRPKTPLTPPTHTHTHAHTHTLPHHHQPSVARPRSGQAGSWETIPVALLTFFISERLKNIPDILLSALLLFLLFLLCLHTFRSNPSFLFFSFFSSFHQLWNNRSHRGNFYMFAKVLSTT